MRIHRGTITAFNVSDTGLCVMTLSDSRENNRVFCRSEKTLQALHDAYGEVLGTVVNTRPFIGKEVYYTVDNDYYLIGFMPVDLATTEIKYAHEHNLGI